MCRTFFLKLIIMSPQGPIIHEMKLSRHHRDNSQKLVLPNFLKNHTLADLFSLEKCRDFFDLSKTGCVYRGFKNFVQKV